MTGKFIGVVSIGLLVASLLPLACSSFNEATTPDAVDGTTLDPDSGGPGVPGTSDLGIEVEIGDPAAPSFVVQGDHVSIPVKLTRKSASLGAVVVTISGTLPDKVKVDPLTIPAKATEGSLVLSADVAAVQAKFQVKVLASEVNGVSALGDLNGFVRGKPGAVDTTFGDAGLLRHIFGGSKNATVRDLVVLDDDRVAPLAQCNSNACVRRASKDGVLETTYGTGGFGALDIYTTSQIADGGNGRVLVAGNGSAYSVKIGRLDAMGKADSTFGESGGFVVRSGSGGPAEQQPVTFAVKKDGTMAVGYGASTSGGRVNNFGAMLFDATGDYVTTFGTGVGLVTSGALPTIGFLPNGDLWMTSFVASTPTGAQAVRVDTSNGVYTSLGGMFPGGDLPLHAGLNGSVVLSDGSLIIAASDGARVVVGKLLPNGSTDLAWGASGLQVLTEKATPSLTLDKDGRAIVLLQEAGGLRFTRLAANGSPDTTFGDSGLVVHSFGDSQQIVCARVQKDGRIVVLSSENFADGTDVALTRYLN